MLRKVKVENGWVEGLPAADPRITSFKGVPFAAPPVGKNRWRAPQPAENWEGVLKAYAFTPVPLQVRQEIDDNNIYTREWAVDPDIPMSEDCLYLNIWTPAKHPDEKLPVYVWFFGGGLQVGHTAEMEFDGERIARRGIVVVTVSYRLNAFGFLCHPEITAESPEAPANFGHLDQLAGARWVKRNIAAFGGDPDNITVGGQSAGGWSVMCQLTSPQSEGLFRRAIIQSGMFAEAYPGAGAIRFHRRLEEAEREGEDFFRFLGVSSLEEARQLDAVYLRDKAVEYGGFWGTVEDGVFNVGDPFDLFLRNKRQMVPIMLGHTTGEFLTAPNAEDAASFEQMAKEAFGEEAETFLRLCDFRSGSVEEAKKRATVNSIELAIRMFAKANAMSAEKPPLYYYEFDAEIPGWDNPGAFHSVDLWFFFETLAKCWRPFTGKHYDLARQMCNYWANFIRSGDPNGPDATGEPMPRWEPHSPGEPLGLRFAERTEAGRLAPDGVMAFLVRHHFASRDKGGSS